MKKATPVIMIVIGLALVIVSFALTWAGLVMAQSPSVGIIGGMDGPTFWFVFSEVFRRTYLWMAVVGTLVSTGGIVGLLIVKFRK